MLDFVQLHSFSQKYAAIFTGKKHGQGRPSQSSRNFGGASAAPRGTPLQETKPLKGAEENPGQAYANFRMLLKSGHIAVPLEKEAEEDADPPQNPFLGVTGSLVRLQPGGWVFPEANLTRLDDVFEFEFQPDDVVVVSFPKCGTTWTQEIVWTMRNNPDLNNPDANTHLFVRSPFIEGDILVNGDDPAPLAEPFLVEALDRLRPGAASEGKVLLELAKATPGPRTLKTHLPFSLLPRSLLDTCKVIYVSRNPFDACVSYWHFARILKMIDFNGTLSDFVDYYVRGDLNYGSYLEHFKDAWSRQGHRNLHLIFYEDLKKDSLREIKKLNSFLGTGLSSEVLSKIVGYTSFSAMEERKTINNENFGGMIPEVTERDGGFFRKEAGDWKQRLSKEDEEKIRSWMDAALKDTGFKFQEDVGK